MLQALTIAAVFAAAPLFAADAGAQSGTWVATRFNDRPLPGVARLRASTGYHHWVKLEEVVLRLKPDGKFAASFRYYHQHLPDRATPKRSPVLTRTYSGRYTRRGSTITFLPDAAGTKKKLAPIPGTFDRSQLRVRYTVVDGGVKHSLRLDLRLDPTYW